MIKLAVFDIDRTLIAPEIGVIAPETLAALKQLQQKGIKIAIASGRLFSFLQPELLEVGFDYYIMSNGCYVTDRDGNILAREQLDPDLPEAFSREMIQKDLPFNIRYCMGQRTGNPNCTVQERMAPIWEKRKFKAKPPKAFLEEYEPKDGEESICFGGFIPEEYLPEFGRKFPRLSFLPVFESPMCDVNPAGISKATGLVRICGLLGIDISQTIAFGDDRNDLEMIETAGIGVAMENGIQAVKNAADYVTASSDKLGVVLALQHFKLID